jgi:hypothetical protein
LAGLFAVGCSANEPPPAVPEWPDAAQVERITAAVSGSVSGQPDIAEFDVPPEFVPAVVRVLSPPEYHEHPPGKHLQEVGQLRVACRDGRVLDVRLYFFGKEPVLFTLSGVPCIRGGPYNNLASGKDIYLPEVLTLEEFLRAVRSGDRVRARKYLELLDRSAGRAGGAAEPRAAPDRGGT